MTTGEAISIMNVIVHMLEPQYDTDRIEDAVEMAIKALEQQPTDAVDRVTIKEYLYSLGQGINVTTTDEDCISRQKAINAIDELYLDGDSCVSFRANLDGDALIGKYQAITALDDLPPVTAQPKMGRWIMSDDGLYRPICNNCGTHPWKGYIPTVEEATEVFKHCPHCGYAMQGAEE